MSRESGSHESAEKAIASLSVADRSDWAMSRRHFLQGALVAAAAGSARLSLPAFLRAPQSATAGGDKVLVVLYAAGGQDTLNMLVPTNQYGAYQALRGAQAVPGESLVPITPSLALNSRLPYLKSLYDQGQVAVLQNVGYPYSTFSHFDAMAVWMAARHDVNRNIGSHDGWIGRWADAAGGNELAVVHIGALMPLYLVGRTRRGVSLPKDVVNPYGASPPSRWETKVVDALRLMTATPTGSGALADSLAAVGGRSIDLGGLLRPAYATVRATRNAANQPLARLTRDMAVAANLVNLNAGVRVIGVEYHDHDTHAGQTPRFNASLSDLNDGIQAFYTALSPSMREKVTILTFSEFGRAARANGSAGCDHGTVGAMLAIGALVRGGVYGDHPSLTDLQHNHSQLKFTTDSIDFRTPLATVVDGWLGGDVNDVFGGSVPTLDLFSLTPTLAPFLRPARESLAVNKPLDVTGAARARRLSVGEMGALSAAYGAVATQQT